MSKTERGIALVTGASSGIGLVTARALRHDGYRVFGTSRKPMPDTQDGITMLICDVTDDASVQAAVDAVLSRAGRIDLLVNNAGIGLLGGAEESSAAQAKAVFDVNVFGVLRMTNAVLPVMRRQRRGRIVNLSSILGLIPAPYNALYASTKHAIEGYSESLDHEVRTQGIRVVLVEPGVTRTSFEENVIRADRPLAVYDAVRADAEKLMRDIVEKGDAPEIVARAVVRAANAASPKRRYTAGKAAGQVRFIRRFLPESFVDKNLRKFNRLAD
ncbi:short-chain dehydrogenase [Pararhizobium polonicum]|uniref:Short-chain dehydrogenase n=1 Tax=Pararhizobium polonicum TaxID=1612624 RepID=A0A1C7NXP6_9HYPH|nr:oxidoreductase [Pararhizobium polonicum]OBZ93787.1 short-chain dehydrogenase [Pararhizobium polonicum]